jgi:hypothetical protein
MWHIIFHTILKPRPQQILYQSRHNLQKIYQNRIKKNWIYIVLKLMIIKSYFYRNLTLKQCAFELGMPVSLSMQ